MMIKSSDQLLARLKAGETVSMQRRFEGEGSRLAMRSDNQACSVVALRRLTKKGAVVVVSTDIAGDAYEWGAA